MKPLHPADPSSLGPYGLVGRLGAGGMGVVYLATNPAGGLAAVKTISAEFASREMLLARFAREAALARRVVSPYVARFLDSEAEGAVPWLAMDYVEGQTLQELVSVTGGISATRLPTLASKLARALADLHACEIVHRDIKPGNVILRGDDPVVIDLGIATDLGLPALTRAQAPGTVGWLSPEQTLGWSAGPRADVFAWGALIVYAASGERPFAGDNEYAVNNAVQHSSANLDRVPPELRQLVGRALEKNPERRPTALELLTVLARVDALTSTVNATLAPMPTTAPPTSHSSTGGEKVSGTSTTPVNAPVPAPQEAGSSVQGLRHCFLALASPGQPVAHVLDELTTALTQMGATVVRQDSDSWTAILEDRLLTALPQGVLSRPGHSVTELAVQRPLIDLINDQASAPVSVLDRWFWLPSQGNGPGRFFSSRWTLQESDVEGVELVLVEPDERRVGAWPEASVTATFARHGKRWTKRDHEWLEETFEAGLPLQDIADRIERTPSAVCDKLVELGHVQPILWREDGERVENSDNRQLA